MGAVDTKRGYVGMCNGRSAQQESGTSYIVKEQRVHGGGAKIYTGNYYYIIVCHYMYIVYIWRKA